MSNCKFITKKELRKKREFISVIFQNVRNDFRKKWNFSFGMGVVGSAKRKLVVKKGNKPWDIDYKLIFLSNQLKKISKSRDLFDMKNDIKELINKYTNDSCKAVLSTSVVTLNVHNKKGGLNMSYDFALINWEKEILRGKTNSTVKWEPIKNFPEAFERYKEIKKSKKWNYFRSIYKPKKCKNTEDKGKIPGYSILAICIKETLEHFNEW